MKYKLRPSIKRFIELMLLLVLLLNLSDSTIFSSYSFDFDKLNEQVGFIANAIKGEEEKPKVKKHPLVHLFLIILLFVALGSFVMNVLDKNNTIYDLISGLILTIFTILFVTISISYHRKSKTTIFISGLLLLVYFLLLFHLFDKHLFFLSSYA